MRGLRIGWSARLGYVENLDPEVEEITTAAAKVFEEMGAHVEEADPDFEEPIGVIETLWHAGAWSVVRSIPESRWNELDPGMPGHRPEGPRGFGSGFRHGGERAQHGLLRDGRLP